MVWGEVWNIRQDVPEICLSCDLRTEQYECMLWDQTVSWDYGCNEWRGRLGKRGP